MGGLPDQFWIDLIDWAKQQSSISEIWLFGSRANETYRSESDVDIAVQIAPSDMNSLAEWICNAKLWKGEIALFTPTGLIVDLECANKEVSPDIVYPAVKDGGVLIYERSKPKIC